VLCNYDKDLTYRCYNTSLDVNKCTFGITNLTVEFKLHFASFTRCIDEIVDRITRFEYAFKPLNLYQIYCIKNPHFACMRKNMRKNKVFVIYLKFDVVSTFDFDSNVYGENIKV
jgi:hypothetical protein